MAEKARDIRISRSATDSHLDFASGLNDGVTVGDLLLRFSIDDISIGALDGTRPAAQLDDRAISLQALSFNGTSFVADTDIDLGDSVLIKNVAVVDPASDYDAANKKYVDDTIDGADLQSITDTGNSTTNSIQFDSFTGSTVGLVGTVRAGNTTAFTGKSLFNDAIYGDSTNPADTITWPGLTGSSDVKINEYQLNLSLQSDVDDIRGQDVGVRIVSDTSFTQRTADEVLANKIYFRLGGINSSGVISGDYVFFDLEPNSSQTITGDTVSGHRVDINDRSSFAHAITNNVNYYANRPTNGTNNYSFWGKGSMRTDEGLIIEGEHDNPLIDVTAPVGFTANFVDLKDSALVTGFSIDSAFNVDVSGDVSVTSSTPSTDSTTGALVVSGGVGIGGSVNISTDATVGGLSGTGDRLVTVDSSGLLQEGVSSDNVVLNNFNATMDPGPSNDSTQNYSVGSSWCNTTDDTAWVCIDDTAGSAVWKLTQHGAFVPTGTASDVAAFALYAQRQFDARQPLYFHSPTGSAFQFDGGLTNSADYNRSPWIGVGRGTNVNNPCRIRFSGTNTILPGSGITGIGFEVADGSTTTLQGFSTHNQFNLPQILFESGINATTFHLQSARASVGRIFIQISSGNSILRVGSRSHLKASYIDINNNTSFLDIDEDSIVDAVQGDGTARVGFAGGSIRDNAHLRFVQWDSSDTIEIHGRSCSVHGTGDYNATNKVSVLVKSTAVGAEVIVSNAEITIETGAEDTVIIGSNNTVTDDGINTQDIDRLKEKVVASTSATPVSISLSDLCTVRTVDSTTAVSVDLPSVDATDTGKWIKIVKLNAGDLTINAADSDIIADSSAGGTISNTTTENYATVHLQLVAADRWVVMGFDGTWITS